MKLYSSIALGLLALAVLISSATAFRGYTVKMIGNSQGSSVLVAEFEHTSSANENDETIVFDLLLPGAIGEYKKMNCVAEYDIHSTTHSAKDRTLEVPVTESPVDKADNNVRFSGHIVLRTGNVFGRLKLACSFVPLMKEVKGEKVTVFVNYKKDAAYAIGRTLIEPFSGFVNEFSASLTTVNWIHASSVFVLTYPSYEASGNTIRIQSSRLPVTTGTSITFRSILPVVECSVSWDNNLVYSDARATVSQDGRYIDIVLNGALNEFFEISLDCPGIISQRAQPNLPAILEVIHQSTSSKSFSSYALGKFHKRDNLQNAEGMFF